MAEITLDKVFADAQRLSPEDQLRLIDMLDVPPPIRPRKTLAQIAAEQGTKPINFEELRRLGEFFPEEESIDDLVNFIRESRRDRCERSIE